MVVSPSQLLLHQLLDHPDSPHILRELPTWNLSRTQDVNQTFRTVQEMSYQQNSKFFEFYSIGSPLLILFCLEQGL